MTRAAIAVMLLFAGAAAWGQTQPVFVATFDEGFDATGPAGRIAAALEGKPELVAGRSGRALKSGPGTGYVQYPAPGVVNPEGGTVEMWVCPLDWTPAEEKFHVFFDIRGEGALYLYKYYQGLNLLMLACENLAGPYFSATARMDWQPGQWHHIAGVWSREGLISYVDGVPGRKLPVEARLPRSLEDSFRIGDHPWHIERTTSSLIDDVRIYDRPLSAAHIAAHFAGNYDFAAPLSEQTTLLRRTVDPASGKVEVRVTTSADVPDARLRAQVGLVPKGGQLPADAQSVPFAAGQVLHTLPLPSLQPGEFEVVARVLQDGQPQLELRSELIVPSFDWRGNTLGKEDRVLPPWTPLEAGDNLVRCWGREYTFTPAGLLAQMTSAGERLLAGPVAVIAKSGEQQAVWTGGDHRQRLSDTRTRLELTGELSGTVGGTAARLAVESWTEYDGLTYITLSVPPGGALPADSLSIEIPVLPQRAIYRHRWARTWAGVTGNLPEGPGVVDSSPFLPYYWLGDNDRGLFWFCESDQFWPNGTAADAVEVQRRDGAVILRLNLLRPGQSLPSGWRFSFGLQATPVKPIPQDWRKWRLQPGRNANVGIIWPTPQPDSLKYFGYPEASNPELFQARVDKLHQGGVKVVPYLCLSFLSAACPEWPFFGARWAMGPVDATSSDVAAYGVGFAMVSPVAEDYADFIVGRTAQFIERYGIDGLYHDNTHPYASASEAAGLGYERDGKRYPTYPILGYRELYRRMYAVMKSVPRESFTMAHMSGKVTIPILAYDDSYLDGEHFRGQVKDCYLDLLPLDTFRAEFMGRQWGIMPFFLPEFDAEHRELVEPTRGLMGLLMVHDVSPWPIWCNAAEMNRALEALDEFGYVQARFMGYFDSPAPASTDMEHVLTSAYIRDGQALLIIANVGREPRAGSVTVNPTALGMRTLSAKSWPEGEALPMNGNALNVSLEGLDWKMVLLSPQ